MIFVVGNNITALFLSAYFEKEMLEYRRIYTNDLMDYTFYCNDPNSGVMAKAMKKLAFKGKKIEDVFFKIRTESKEYTIEGNLDNLFQQMIQENVDKATIIEELKETIQDVGTEWNEIINNGFSMKINMNSAMAKNYMKSYETAINMVQKQEIQNICMSLVPRRDISLNTAAGYITNQVFDKRNRKDQVEDFVSYIKSYLKEKNQIKIDSFEEIVICQDEKKIIWNAGQMSYDVVIFAADKSRADNKLATFYVENEKKDDTYVFLCREDMKTNGINQMILWNGKNGCQLDTYFNNQIDEKEIVKYVEKHFPYIKINKMIAYEELQKQYGCGDFAGWAFSCKENMKNPMIYKNPGYINISKWGNAHFTSALLVLNCLEKAHKI